MRMRIPRHIAQGALGTLGAVGLVVGFVIAWRAKSATPVVVVSGLLLVIAWVGDRWESLVLRHGGNELEIRARQGAEIAREIAERPDVPEDIKDDLDRLQWTLVSHRDEILRDGIQFRPMSRVAVAADLVRLYIGGRFGVYGRDANLMCEIRLPGVGGPVLTRVAAEGEVGVHHNASLDIPRSELGDGFHFVRWYWSDDGTTIAEDGFLI